MFKLDLEKAEEPEIKLPTSAGSRQPAQGATSGWVIAGLVFKWCPLCEFSLFDTL